MTGNYSLEHDQKSKIHYGRAQSKIEAVNKMNMLLYRIEIREHDPHLLSHEPKHLLIHWAPNTTQCLPLLERCSVVFVILSI